MRKDDKKRRNQQESFPRSEGNIIPVSFGGSLDRWGGSSKPGSASSAESGGGGRGGSQHRSNTIAPAMPLDTTTTAARAFAEESGSSVRPARPVYEGRMSIGSIKRSISSKVLT